MAGPVYYDVAHGKPNTQDRNPDTSSSTQQIDLLWRYRFNWIILDRWTNEHLEVPVQGQEVPSPLLSIQYSIDGTDFQEIGISRTVICSDKGSKGSHRSLQVIFSTPCVARYFRISYPDSGWTYTLRASQRNDQMSASERSKIIEPYGTLNAPLNSPRVNVAVLGDSNSVMRYGWVKGLSQGGLHVTDNVSLGSSSNAILSTQLQNLSNNHVDALIVNITVNEYQPARDDYFNHELSKQFVRGVQSWCAERGSIPIFIIYPNRHAYDDQETGQNTFDQTAHYTELCEDLDVPYIDAISLLEALADKWKRPIKSLFMDPSHLNHPTSQIIGSIIGERINQFFKFEKQSANLIVSTNNLTHEFRTVSLSEHPISLAQEQAEKPGLEFRHLKTSLVEQDMLNLHYGQSLSVATPENFELVAFTMNARSCNAGIVFSGENVVKRRADFAGYEGKGGYPFVCVRSLEKAIKPKNGYIKIELAAPEQQFDRDEISNKVIPILSDHDYEIEISQLTFRSIVRHKRYLRIKNINLNLTHACNIGF